MVIDWNAVKAVRIPEGDCKRVAINGTVVWEKGGLPSEYQQVVYIESSGTQYLQIPYTMTRGAAFAIEAMLSRNKNYDALISVGTERYQIVILLSAGRVSFFKYFATGAAAEFKTVPINYKLLFTVTSDGALTVTNEESGDIIAQTTSAYQQEIDGADTNLYIGRRANDYPRFAGKIYSFTLSNGGTDVLNLVPCYRIADGEIGMYDLVNGVFYTNQGSGTFIKGEDV